MIIELSKQLGKYDLVNKEELARQKKEMEELIEIGKKNKQAYMNMLDELDKQLDRLVAIKERY